MDRKYIRKAVQQVLKDFDIPGIGAAVFSQRSIPTNIDTLPIIIIYSNDVQVSRFNEACKDYMKNLSLTIEIITQNDDDELLMDELDDLSLVVESIMENARDLENQLEYINLQSVRYKTEGDGQSPVGSAILTYDIKYYFEPDLMDSLDELRSINTIFKKSEDDNNLEDNINYI